MVANTVRQPRLLFLAYPFPPSRAIGAVRTWNLTKQLALRGWKVTVLTFDPSLLLDPDPEVEVEAWCSVLDIQRVLTGHGARFFVRGWLRPRWPWDRSRVFSGALRRALSWAGLDVGFGWMAPARRICSGFHRGDFDIVMASAPPFSTFQLAKWIAHRIEAPLVLDYRDLWSQTPEPARSPARSPRARETEIVESAALVLNVSWLSAECLTSNFHLRRPPVVITNGYDADDLAGVRPQSNGGMSVVYTGAFVKGQREAGPIMMATTLANTFRKPTSSRIRFHYYGPSEDHVSQIAALLGCTDSVVNHGNVTRRKALAAVKGATVAAVVATIRDTGSLAERGIVTGKLFEAIGLGTRVMLIAPAGSDAGRIVDECAAGRHFRGSQTREMAEWLASLDEEHWSPDRERATGYSWSVIGDRLDAALRACVLSIS